MSFILSFYLNISNTHTHDGASSSFPQCGCVAGKSQRKDQWTFSYSSQKYFSACWWDFVHTEYCLVMLLQEWDLWQGTDLKYLIFLKKIQAPAE